LKGGIQQKARIVVAKNGAIGDILKAYYEYPNAIFGPIGRLE